MYEHIHEQKYQKKNKPIDYSLHENRNNWRNHFIFQDTQARMAGI